LDGQLSDFFFEWLAKVRAIYMFFPQHVLIISLSLLGEHTVITKNE